MMRTYFFAEWKANLRARPLVTLMVVVLAAGGLAGSAFLRTELMRVKTFWDHRFSQSHLELCFDHSLSAVQITDLAEELLASPALQEAQFFSAEEARREAEQYLGTMVFSVLPENPLPATLRLIITPEFRRLDYLAHLTDSLAALDGVTAVISAEELIDFYAQGRSTLDKYAGGLFIASLVWTALWLFIGVLLVLRLRSPARRVWFYLGVRPQWFRRLALAEGMTLGVLVSIVALILTRAVSAGETSITQAWSAGDFGLFLMGPLMIGSLAGWLAYRVQRYRGAQFHRT